MHCTADRNEQVCSLCNSQQVLSDHNTVGQIMCHMQAPYKTLVCADRFKCQAHMLAGVFLA
jgi:hypothetical protein